MLDAGERNLVIRRLVNWGVRDCRAHPFGCAQDRLFGSLAMTSRIKNQASKTKIMSIREISVKYSQKVSKTFKKCAKNAK